MENKKRPLEDINKDLEAVIATRNQLQQELSAYEKEAKKKISDMYENISTQNHIIQRLRIERKDILYNNRYEFEKNMPQDGKDRLSKLSKTFGIPLNELFDRAFTSFTAVKNDPTDFNTKAIWATKSVKHKLLFGE